MAEWTNLFQTTGVMLKIGPVCLALVGLMGGWQAISLADTEKLLL